MTDKVESRCNNLSSQITIEALCSPPPFIIITVIYWKDTFYLRAADAMHIALGFRPIVFIPPACFILVRWLC